MNGLFQGRWALAAEEPEIQADETEQKVDRGAHATELRRLNCVRTQEKDRDFPDVEVELHSATDEECSGEVLAIRGIARRCTVWLIQNDDGGREIWNHGSPA